NGNQRVDAGVLSKRTRNSALAAESRQRRAGDDDDEFPSSHEPPSSRWRLAATTAEVRKVGRGTHRRAVSDCDSAHADLARGRSRTENIEDKSQPGRSRHSLGAAQYT